MMLNKSSILAIIIIILFATGIIFLSIFDVFSKNWLIGIGLLAAGVGAVALLIFVRMRS